MLRILSVRWHEGTLMHMRKIQRAQAAADREAASLQIAERQLWFPAGKAHKERAEGLLRKSN